MSFFLDSNSLRLLQTIQKIPIIKIQSNRKVPKSITIKAKSTTKNMNTLHVMHVASFPHSNKAQSIYKVNYKLHSLSEHLLSLTTQSLGLTLL